MKNLKEFKPIIDLLKGEKWKFFLVSILLLVCEIAGIFTGYLNGAAIEEITNNHLKTSIIYLLIYLLLQLTFDGLIYILATNELIKIESKLTRRIGFNTYCKALNLPAYAYEKMSSGEVINRLTHDAETLSFTFKQLIITIGSMISAFILMFYIFYNSWIIGLEILILIIALILIFKIYNPKMKKAHKERKKEQDKYTSLSNESIRGIREIKTLGIRRNLIEEMRELIKILYQKSINEINIQIQFSVFTKIIRITMEIGVFITCAILLFYKQISLTFFIAMTYYVYKYMYLIGNLSEFNETYQRVSVAIGRINEILLNKTFDDETYGDKKIKNCKGIIEFKNVTFGYPGEKNIINNLNLKLEPNKKIALVGRSGQGKSTLFSLLTRVFDIEKGEITLDGINIKDLDEESLRKNISIIRQEPFVFNRTIKDNFKMINKNITLKEIRKYTEYAYLDDYIMSLPKKYNTILGEGGVNLSGGQKQRLSIARTLTKNTKVILFDEATSALDNNSQEYIKETINNLVKDHTVVIVAHRLSTIIDADIIYIVDGGKIVGSGSHEELLKTNKIYKNLYETESLNS